MLVVFILDTSASMNQRISSGLTLLDCAKSAVEHFHKVRQRDASCRVDRYMLATCQDGPAAIKVFDKFPFTHFLRVLKSVRADEDMSCAGGAMQRTFDFLHLQRLAADIDRFGQGRNPCSIDPTMVMLLTDGTELTSPAGVSAQLMLPGGPMPVGADLAVQPFRWDQRVFATVLRIPAVSAGPLEKNGGGPHGAGPMMGAQSTSALDANISAFCEVTGGKCVVVTSWKVLMQHMEVMASRLLPAVIVSFEAIPLPGTNPTPPQVQAACQRKLLFVRAGQVQGQGQWPIPEAAWPDAGAHSLAPRDAHPIIAYKAVDGDPYIPANFVFDKYEVEANPVLQFLGKAPAGVCWQVFIRNSSKGGASSYGDPFGYLRLNRVGTTLTLFVLPYNYPVLWGLLDQLSKGPNQPKATPSAQWRLEMEQYCASIPPYYLAPLRAALKRWSVPPHVVPDSLDANLASAAVAAQLKRVKVQAKAEIEREHGRLMGTQAEPTASGQILPWPRREESARVRMMPPPAPSGRGASDAPLPLSAPIASGASAPVPGAPGGVFGVAGADLTGGGRGGSSSSSLSLEALLPSGPSPSASGAAAGSVAGHDSAPTSGKEGVVFKNPFDVSRADLFRLVQQLPLRLALALESRKKGDARAVAATRTPLSQVAASIAAAQLDAARHHLPIEKMGDFNEALKQQQPRNPYAEEADRTKQARSMFGNPYRQDKSEGGADEAWLEGANGGFSRGRKRRRRKDSPGGGSTSTSSSGSGAGSPSGGSMRDTAGGAEVLPPGVKSSSPASPPQLQAGNPKEIAPQARAQERTATRLKKSHQRAAKSEGPAVPPPGMPGEKGLSNNPRRQTGEIVMDWGGTLKECQEIAQEISSRGEEDEASQHRTLPPGNTEWPGQVAAAGRDGPGAGAPAVHAFPSMRGLTVVTPQGAERPQEEAVQDILSILRALRGVRGGFSTQQARELFARLAAPDLPVDRPSLVRHLVVQAELFKKHALAEDLSKYLGNILVEDARV